MGKSGSNNFTDKPPKILFKVGDYIQFKKVETVKPELVGKFGRIEEIGDPPKGKKPIPKFKIQLKDKTIVEGINPWEITLVNV